MQVVDDHDEWGTARGELGEDVVQAVPDALRVDGDRLAARTEQSDGGADGVVPVAEDLVALGLGEPAEYGLEQLAQDVVRLGVLLLAAPGEEHGAALPGVGAPADLVQQRRLAHAGVAGEDQQLADLGAAGGELTTQLVDGQFGGADLGVAVAQLGVGLRGAATLEVLSRLPDLPDLSCLLRPGEPAVPGGLGARPTARDRRTARSTGLALDPAPQFAFLGHRHALRLADPCLPVRGRTRSVSDP